MAFLSFDGNRLFFACGILLKFVIYWRDQKLGVRKKT